MTQLRAVVVGAGPSGVATALTLSRAGHPVTVLDRGHFPRDKACGEGLLPPGVAALRRLGVIADVLATGSPRINGVSYRHVGRSAEAYAPFPAPPDGSEPWGLGVRRTHFDAALIEALRRDPRIMVLEGVRAKGLVRDAAGVVAGVTTASDTIAAEVVIAADGLHSAVRAAAGLTCAASGRPRYGLAGHWALDVRDLDRIQVTFADQQEWYQCPVGPDLLLVSTLADRSRIGDTSRRYASAAMAALPLLRDAELVGRPLAAGVFRQRPRAVAAGGVFLVGDAAGYDDPTTGEGIGMGLLLGERLGVHVGAFLSGRIDRGEAEARYRRDHAALSRDRRRVTALALLMARHPSLNRRAVARAAERPHALGALLGVNCGYWGFGRLAPRDWLSLAGF